MTFLPSRIGGHPPAAHRAPAREEGVRWAFSARVRLGVFVSFVLVTALTGGGSRGDISSLVVLRPLAALFGLYGWLAMPRGALAAVKAPMLFLAALFTLISLQLIPLPPVVWHALPGRGAVSDIDALLGLRDVWRPLALSPSGAWNALFSLVVPAAGLLLFAALEPADRRALPAVVTGVAVVSALLGLMQMLAGPDSVFYLYSITNEGSPVGLFSNRNHNAVFLASAIPVAACWLYLHGGKPSWRVGVAWAAGGLFAFVALVSGSRAGAALTIPGAICGVLLMRETIAGSRRDRVRKRKDRPAPGHRQRVILFCAGAILVALLAATLHAIGRTPLTDVMSATPEDEVRYQVLPTLGKMLSIYWSAGLGVGSFAAVYQIYEPTTLLSSSYLNHAHDDVLEFVLEGGLPGIALLLCGVAFAIRAGTRVWHNTRFPRALRAAILAPPAILAAASLLDYPLRTPSLAVFVTLWTCACLTADRSFAAPASRGRP